MAREGLSRAKVELYSDTSAGSSSEQTGRCLFALTENNKVGRAHGRVVDFAAPEQGTKLVGVKRGNSKRARATLKLVSNGSYRPKADVGGRANYATATGTWQLAH